MSHRAAYLRRRRCALDTIATKLHLVAVSLDRGRDRRRNASRGGPAARAGLRRLTLFLAGVACSPPPEVEAAAAGATAGGVALSTPAPRLTAERPQQAGPRRAPLRFVSPWTPDWRVEFTSSRKIHLGALEEGIILYVTSDQPPFDRTPCRLLDGRLVSISGMGVVRAEKYEPHWLEFYGRSPDALWRIVLPTPSRGVEISRWTDGAWRPSAPFPQQCELDLVGHSFDGDLLVATRHCAREEGGAPIELHQLEAGGPSRVGPVLSQVPQLALATSEALYLAGFFDTPPTGGSKQLQQTIRRFPCAAPYDCAPEVLSLDGLPGVLTWLDHTWQRQWQGLAHRQGVTIVHQRSSEGLEAYVLAYDAEGWRTVPAPGRIRALVAVADERVVVTRAPAGDAELANGDWPESKPAQRGDTLWLLGAGATDWQPIQLPSQALHPREIQVAAEGRKLWLAAWTPDGLTLFSTSR